MATKTAMQQKIFLSADYESFDKFNQDVNDFLKSVHAVDIKMSSTSASVMRPLHGNLLGAQRQQDYEQVVVCHVILLILFAPEGSFQ